MGYFRVIGSLVLGGLCVLIFGDLVWLKLSSPILLTFGLVLLPLALLALVFVRSTTIKESAAKIVLRNNKFHRALFATKDYRLDPVTWKLIHDDQYRHKVFGSEFLGEWLGGLRFYIWLLESIYLYDWDWVKSMPDGSLMPREHKQEDHILVGYDYPYGMEMTSGILTSNNYPLDVTVTLTAQIVNPYKALFKVKWFVELIAGVKPSVKDYINSKTYDEIVVAAAKTVHIDELFEELKERKIINLLEERYGVRLHRVEFSKVKLTPEREKQLLQEQEGIMAGKKDSAKRTGSTTAPFLEMVAAELGATTPEHVAKIREAYRKNPAGFEKTYAGLIKRCKDWIDLQISADTPGALKNIQGDPLGGLVTLLGEAFRGGSGSDGSKPKPIADDSGEKKKKGSGKEIVPGPSPGYEEFMKRKEAKEKGGK